MSELRDPTLDSATSAFESFLDGREQPAPEPEAPPRAVRGVELVGEEEPEPLDDYEAPPARAAEPAEEVPEEEPPEPVEDPEVVEDEGPLAFDFDESYIVRIPTENGVEEVTLGDLRRAGLRQADYSRKTAELSAQREEVQAQATAFEEALGVMRTVREALEANLSRYQPSAESLRELQETDPGRFAMQMLAQQQQQAQLDEARQLEQQAEQALIQKRAQEEKALLQEKLPDVFGGDKFLDAYTDLGRWVVEERGVDPQVWADAIDHQVISLAWMAREYEKLTRSKPKARARLANLPKVARPGTPSDPGHTRRAAEKRSLTRHAEVGSIDSAADAIAERLFGGPPRRRR